MSNVRHQEPCAHGPIFDAVNLSSSPRFCGSVFYDMYHTLEKQAIFQRTLGPSALALQTCDTLLQTDTTTKEK